MSAPKLSREALRLEVIRLVHRFDLAPAALIERASELETWIVNGSKVQADKPDEGPAAKP